MDKRVYNAYLNSEHWLTTRRRIKRRDGHSCMLCGHPVQEVHHVNYRNLTDVTDSDLMSMCQECHAIVHKAVVAGHIPDPHLNESSIEKTRSGLHDYREARGHGKGTVLSRGFVEKLNTLSQQNKCHVWTWMKMQNRPSMLELEGVYVGKNRFRKLVKLYKRHSRSLHIPTAT